jgi:quercetin dioxygenase-like cupin family protein
MNKRSIKAATKSWVVLGVASIAVLSVMYRIAPPAKAMAQAKHAPIVVNRIYAGLDGLAHWEKVEMKLSVSTAISGMEQSEQFGGASVSFVRRPPQVVQDWHPGGQPQYAVTISGQGEIEVADGQKVVLGPGSIVLVEDMGSKGHKTRTSGSEDWIMMIGTLPKK